MDETIKRFAEMLSAKVRAARVADYERNYSAGHTPEQREAFAAIVDRDCEVAIKPGKKYVRIDLGKVA